MLQAGPAVSCEQYGNGTSAAGYTCDQLQALPISYALVTGLSTILMGLIAGVPFTVAPGLAYSTAFQNAAKATGSPENILACNIVVGLLILLFGATSKRTKVLNALPNDYRLGLAAGIGGFLALIAVRSMNLVVPLRTTYVSTFSYKTILGLAGVILIAVVSSFGEQFASLSFIISITTITVVSVIIRASLNEPILPPGYESGVASLAPLVSELPSFDNWSANGFVIFKYIVLQTMNKIFNLQATIMALILLTVYVPGLFLRLRSAAETDADDD